MALTNGGEICAIVTAWGALFAFAIMLTNHWALRPLHHG
jgi:hypothetical protein